MQADPREGVFTSSSSSNTPFNLDITDDSSPKDEASTSASELSDTNFSSYLAIMEPSRGYTVAYPPLCHTHLDSIRAYGDSPIQTPRNLELMLTMQVQLPLMRAKAAIAELLEIYYELALAPFVPSEASQAKIFKTQYRTWVKQLEPFFKGELDKLTIKADNFNATLEPKLHLSPAMALLLHPHEQDLLPPGVEAELPKAPKDNLAFETAANISTTINNIEVMLLRRLAKQLFEQLEYADRDIDLQVLDSPRCDLTDLQKIAEAVITKLQLLLANYPQELARTLKAEQINAEMIADKKFESFGFIDLRKALKPMKLSAGKVRKSSLYDKIIKATRAKLPEVYTLLRTAGMERDGRIHSPRTIDDLLIKPAAAEQLRKRLLARVDTWAKSDKALAAEIKQWLLAIEKELFPSEAAATIDVSPLSRCKAEADHDAAAADSIVDAMPAAILTRFKAQGYGRTRSATAGATTSASPNSRTASPSLNRRRSGSCASEVTKVKNPIYNPRLTPKGH